MKTEKYPLDVLLRRKAVILYIVIAARERGMISRGNNVYAVISCLYSLHGLSKFLLSICRPAFCSLEEFCYLLFRHIRNRIMRDEIFQ
jgi:hypothetical protein